MHDGINVPQEIAAANERILKLESRLQDMETAIDQMHAADARAIRKWQTAHRGQQRIWPERQKLTTWLIDRAEHLESILARIVHQVTNEANGHHTLYAFKFGAAIEDAKIALRTTANGKDPTA